jgi:NAD(P)H-hydrate repair Nnr-like enzyme with NAD(P)H-hydrate dehydratase domain
MDRTYWLKQTVEQPLFPDLLWSRPENRAHAGKLLIIGGNLHGFSAVGEAYRETEKAGIGTARVILPNSLQRTVGKLFPEAEFAPSTPSGSFARTALSQMLELASWADGILLAGDFGRNSETAIVLEQFLVKFDGPVTVTKDAVDYFTAHPHRLLNRGDSSLVVSFAQLQKVAQNSRFTTAFTFDMDLLRLIDALHDFSQQYPAIIITKHHETIFVASNGHVSSTKLAEDKEIWRVRTATHTAVWWLQNHNNTFAAITTAIN